MSRSTRTISALFAAAALALSACTSSGNNADAGASTEEESANVTYLEVAKPVTFKGDAQAQSIAASSALFGSSSLAVLAPEGSPKETIRAASIGRALGVPTLAVSTDTAGVVEELKRLDAEAVIVAGDVSLPDDSGVDVYRAPANAADLTAATGIEVKGSPMPESADAQALRELAERTIFETTDATSPDDGVEVPKKGSLTLRADKTPGGTLALVSKDPATVAAEATAAAAGVKTSPSEGDFRGSGELIKEVKQAGSVIGIGDAFPDAEDFAWEVEVAKSGQELPGGGQLVFSGKRYVALYGTPVTHSLGVLGEQDGSATIDRAAKLAAEYQELTEDEVIPALEIIVTVASGKAGDDGNYSNEWAIEHFTPLIEAAGEAGQYVVIDFQPGRADFLSQVKQYEELLKYPHVGIALDPEWRLGPNERPLTRIGHVEVDEVNQVIDYLAQYTKENKLPQKMVILHQFQIQMLRDRAQVNTSHPEVAVLIHADGQGTQPQKNDTWQALLKDAPEGVHWGWKNFIDEDHPMLTPEQTYRIEPQPHFVSYQ